MPAGITAPISASSSAAKRVLLCEQSSIWLQFSASNLRLWFAKRKRFPNNSLEISHFPPPPPYIADVHLHVLPFFAVLDCGHAGFGLSSSAFP